mgnify:CR=1 FL=1
MAYERRLAVMSAKERKSYVHPYVVEKGNKRRNDTIQYRYILTYEAWMEDAKLVLQRDECGCGESTLMSVEPLIDKVTLERILFPYVVAPYLAYLQPVAEEVKRRDIQAECFLDFEVNKVNIRPEYMNNPKELAKIRTMIDDLKADPSIKVNRLDIIGYASPEGSLANNKRLSEGRAMALRDYLATRYDFARNQYHIIFGGENWEGLVNALDTIDIEYKDEILDIIEYTSLEQGRESKLMKLRGGVPYRYMLKNIFPSLRVAICKVNYDIKNFDVDEAREVIKKRPQNLSLNEMFLVANTYPAGSQEFIDVFETAVRMYPEDEVANMNAAAAALSRNDLISAERYLGMVNSKKHLPEYTNAMGVLMLLKGEYEHAEEYLKAAAKSGLQAAGQNLEKTMSQKNMGRLAQDMKRELIAIIGRLKDPRLEGGLLTVTRLDVTPDLDVAKVYVSVMGREDGPKPAIEALNRAAGHVRTEVSKKMHIRKAPRFIFVEDDGAAYAAHINELLRTLNVNGDAEDSQPAETEE